MAEGQSVPVKSVSAREAEDLLRQATRTAEDPFVALTQSYKRKVRETLPIAWDDEER